MTDTAPLDLDEPVPYTLTLLGYLALAVDGPRPVEALPPGNEPGPVDEWACHVCGPPGSVPCPTTAGAATAGMTPR
jgi:hypothetical protein